MAQAPVIALVGATGLVGSALLSTFLSALNSGRIAHLRLLTTSPSSPALDAARAHASGRVSVHAVRYTAPATLQEALKGADVLVSAMGAQQHAEGRYEDNKARLLDAAVKAGVKIYVPSEFGTDHNGQNQDVVQSPMFANKQHHHAEAASRGLQVLAFYSSLITEISFSDWLGIPTSSPSPAWTLPRPERPVAFTSLRDIGRFVLSAILQTHSSSAAPGDASAPVPDRLRVYSDLLTLDEAADLWERAAGGTVQREYVDTEGLRARYEEIKPTLAPGMLGPAIPLMISLGGFDYTQENHNALLNTGDYAFEPRSVKDFLEEKAKEVKKAEGPGEA
ncbi:hypothetical protein JCM10449v2_007050 [Rhodotorula kratochvilovae]